LAEHVCRVPPAVAQSERVCTGKLRGSMPERTRGHACGRGTSARQCTRRMPQNREPLGTRACTAQDTPRTTFASYVVFAAVPVCLGFGFLLALCSCLPAHSGREGAEPLWTRRAIGGHVTPLVRATSACLWPHLTHRPMCTCSGACSRRRRAWLASGCPSDYFGPLVQACLAARAVAMLMLCTHWLSAAECSCRTWMCAHEG
jgi:hypothetical protein